MANNLIILQIHSPRQSNVQLNCVCFQKIWQNCHASCGSASRHETKTAPVNKFSTDREVKFLHTGSLFNPPSALQCLEIEDKKERERLQQRGKFTSFHTTREAVWHNSGKGQQTTMITHTRERTCGKREDPIGHLRFWSGFNDHWLELASKGGPPDSSLPQRD